MQKEDQQLSKYNSGVNIIIRLDKLWTDTHTFARNGLFGKWNSTLDRIWVELARDLTDTQYCDKKDEDNKVIKKGNKTLFEDFDKALEQTGNFKDNQKDSFNKLLKKDIENRNKQYKILMQKELFLRRLENKLGKGTAWDSQADLSF